MKNFIIFSLLFLLTQPAKAQDYWEQTNGPEGGYISCIVVDTNDPNQTVLYAGTSGGVFRSTDSAETWIKTGLQNTSISNLYISNSNLYAVNLDRIFFSNDNGFNWTTLNISGLYDVVVSGNNLVAGGQDGIFLSTNNGANWTQVSGTRTFQLLVQGTNLFAVTYVGSGVLLSTDNGNIWKVASNDLLNKEVRCLVTNENNLYAATGYGVFLSTNNGTNWTNISDLNTTYILIDETDLYAIVPYGGIYKSTDNGLNWTFVSNEITTEDINSIKLNSNGDLIAGTSTGIFISTNGGINWKSAKKGLNISNIRSLYSQGKKLFAGRSEGWGGTAGSLFLSTDDGISWTELNNELFSSEGISAITSVSDELGKTNLLAGTIFYNDFFEVSGGVYLSTDDGFTWTNTNAVGGVSNFVIKDKNLFAGTTSWTSSIYFSTDLGLNWTPVNNGLPHGNPDIYGIASYGNNIFACTSPGTRGLPYDYCNIYKSTDNGANWVFASYLPIPGVTAFAIISNGSNDFNLFAGTYDGVFMSTDEGSSWIKANNGLENTSVNCFAVSDSILFAGTYGGIFYSTNNGSNWVAFNDGLTKPAGAYYPTINTLLLKGSYLYAGIQGGGVWKRKIVAITTSAEYFAFRPEQFSLEQNYPNPFNPTTTISFSIPTTEFVTLKVFDVLGKEVATLVDECKSAGSYEVDFSAKGGDASQLSSGVYFYKLQASYLIETRKMIIIR